MVKWKLVPGSIQDTKTAAGHFATGYRNRKGRFGGVPKPRGSVKVAPVGRKWGVYEAVLVRRQKSASVADAYTTLHPDVKPRKYQTPLDKIKTLL